MLMLMCVNELRMNMRGLGNTGDLLRMSLNNAVLEDGKRRSVANKLVARGRRSWNGGLAAFDRVDNGVGDVFDFLGRAGVEIVFAIVIHILLIFLSGGDNNFNLTIEHHAEAIATGGFLSAGNTRAVAPVIQFPTKGVSFGLERTKFTSSNQPVTARGVNVSNGRINDRGLGRATNLREVWQKGSEIQEATVESFTTLPFHCVVSRPSLSGICTPAGFSLSSRSGRDRRRVGIGVNIRERLRDR